MVIAEQDQDSSWLDIDHFPDSNLGFEDCATEDECHEMGTIEDMWRSDGVKEVQAQG